MNCHGQEPFKVNKSDKLIIIDSHPDRENELIRHELIRIDFKEQLKYFRKFLSIFIFNKKSIAKIISSIDYNLKSGKKYNNTFSSYRINDRVSNIDFMEYQEIGKILFLWL